MRRGVGIAFAVAVAVVAVTFASGAGGDENGTRRYWLELDNAFGLVEGADVKVAGVRAGTIETIELERRNLHALVELKIRRAGFGDLRADVSCETRPQSLIGEYFVDCAPGTSPRKLPDGARIPVDRTATTVPPDLVNEIMRRPYRERFAIIYDELGGALAARGDDLNETIRRASPALREVDRVLAILRRQRRTIRDLYGNAERVFDALARSRRDVSRFVAEARDTAGVSASRISAVRRNLRLLPRFLSQLQPTVELLGESSQRQEGALRNLDSSSALLRRLFAGLGPFADASRPAMRTLGAAARQGTPAAKAALPRVRELRRAAKALPELSGNLAVVLEHLDDRKHAIEKDPRSPGGAGYTGLEAVLRYIFAQSQAINLVDANNYILKVAVFLDRECAAFFDAKAAKNPALRRCLSILGPGRPGIDEPDPTAPAAKARAERAPARRAPKRPAATHPAATERPAVRPPTNRPAPAPDEPPVLVVPSIQRLLDYLLG